MKPCRTKYKKAINSYKYGRVARSPLSKHCKVRVSCYDGILEGWLMGEYLFVVLPRQEQAVVIDGWAVSYVGGDYFRYYVGGNTRTDHVMYYETGLDYRF